MKRMVLFTIGVVGIVCVSVRSTAEQAPPQQAPSQPEIAGVYECHGANPDGTSYDGIVKIVKVRGTFRVRWTLESASVVGVGIYSNGILAVSYFGGAPAVAVYKLDGNRLVGEWTMGGAEGTTYPEVLTRTTEDKRPPPRELPKPEPRKGTSPVGIAL